MIEVGNDGETVFRQYVTPLEECQRHTAIPGSPTAEGTQRTYDSITKGQGIQVVGSGVAGNGTESKLLEDGGVIPLVGGNEKRHLPVLEYLDKMTHHVPIFSMLEIILTALPCLIVATADVNAYDEIAFLLIPRHLPVHDVADVGIGPIDGQQLLLEKWEILVRLPERP